MQVSCPSVLILEVITATAYMSRAQALKKNEEDMIFVLQIVLVKLFLRIVDRIFVLQAFLATQDDAITDEEAAAKYGEYKQEFR